MFECLQWGFSFGLAYAVQCCDGSVQRLTEERESAPIGISQLAHRTERVRRGTTRLGRHIRRKGSMTRTALRPELETRTENGAAWPTTRLGRHIRWKWFYGVDRPAP